MTHQEFVIISTAIPKHLLTTIEVEALLAFGLIMFDDGFSYTISSGLENESFPVLEADDPPQMLFDIAVDYRNEDKPDWVANIEHSLAYLVDLEIETVAKFPLTAYHVTVLGILEDCLQKQANTSFAHISEILVEGSYYADQAQLETNGGWAAKVTPQGTELLTERFRQGERQRALCDQGPFAIDPSLAEQQINDHAFALHG